MNARKFLEDYQQLQYSTMGDKLIDLKFASVILNDTGDGELRNYALLRRNINDPELKNIETILIKNNRRPSVYFDSSLENSIQELLNKNSYKKDWEDSWMIYPKQVQWDKSFEKIKLVESEEDLKTFLETLDQCYRNDDPQNPYGENGHEYLKMTEEAWRLHKDTGRVEHFTLYHGSKPVAVTTLMNSGNTGYISNVGSLIEVRGKGFGKTVSLFSVYRSIQNGNKIHCLATEKGHYPYDFYKYIGFKPKFTSISLSKH